MTITIAIQPTRSTFDASKPFASNDFLAGATVVVITANSEGRVRALAFSVDLGDESFDFELGSTFDGRHAKRSMGFGELTVVAAIAANGATIGELPTKSVPLRLGAFVAEPVVVEADEVELVEA